MGGKYSREQFAARLGADGEPRLNAAAGFAARLLNGPAGELVARIVLSGSVARRMIEFLHEQLQALPAEDDADPADSGEADP